MNKIIYYVASSLDGYIAGPDEDISLFAASGAGVDHYLKELGNFKTVIMGRRTYEFGFKFGLEPGQPAYPHMTHHIFSSSLRLENAAESVHIETLRPERVEAIRKTSPTDVYLCGGGMFAGYLLQHGLIDQVRLKLNPIVLGGGIPLFAQSTACASWTLTDQKSFADGLQILSYDLKKLHT